MAMSIHEALSYPPERPESRADSTSICGMIHSGNVRAIE
jgi:hypothetical protein